MKVIGPIAPFKKLGQCIVPEDRGIVNTMTGIVEVPSHCTRFTVAVKEG